jgi:hypothetical protein
LPQEDTVAEGVESLKGMCDNILQLLATSVPAMEPLLWPHLLDYLLAPDFSNSVTPVTKALIQLQSKKNLQQLCIVIDYDNFQHLSGPYALFARLIVLAAVPFSDSRGGHILTFLQMFAPNISKHIPSLWQVRIPLLQHYLDSHVSNGSNSVTLVTWDQEQWEEWLLALIDDTLVEIDLEEWTSALAGAMCQQMPLYAAPELSLEKCFLMRCVGVVAKRLSNKQIVVDFLSSVFLFTSHAEEDQQKACAFAFGSCAATAKHLRLVVDKLEVLLKSGFPKKSGSFFGLLRDNRLEEQHINTRNTVVLCVGQAALRATKADLAVMVDEMINKFIMPALISSNHSLKITALKAVSDVAKAIQPGRSDDGREINLAHHGDLVHEAIK